MKKFINLLLFLPFLIFAETGEDAFVVVLMIKNDEAIICQSLEPYVQAGMQSFLIYDICSTDNTLQVVNSYFQEHNIKHYYIFQEPFKEDMITSQNRALELAEQCFPYAQFIFMPWRPEWQLHNVPMLQQFCREQKDASVNCYTILVNHQINNRTLSDKQHPALIRAHTKTRFTDIEYPIFICVTANTVQKLPEDIYFTHTW